MDKPSKHTNYQKNRHDKQRRQARCLVSQMIEITIEPALVKL